MVKMYVCTSLNTISFVNIASICTPTPSISIQCFVQENLIQLGFKWFRTHNLFYLIA